MNILGINCFSHDTSAALLKDGALLAFAEEERFNRQKHTHEFPDQSIQYCLQKGDLSIKDIDYVAFPFIPLKDLRRGLADFSRNPLTLLRFAGQVRFDYRLAKKVRSFKKKYDYRNKVAMIGHHEAHTSNSFFSSPFEEAALLSIDRGGDYISTFLGKGKGSQISTINEINNPHSLGSFYSCVTNFLGFKPNGGEGKVMGLAPYGKSVFYEDFQKMIKLEEGRFKLDLSYFTFHLKGGYEMSRKFIDKFGPPRQPEGEITNRDKDIAWALQKVTEDAATYLANWLYEKTRMDFLCLSGGLALNGVMNHVIRQRTPFKDIFIQPAANDGGTSMGAAYYVWHNMLKNPRRELFDHCYLGPEFDDSQIRETIISQGFKYTSIDDPAQRAAELLKEGKIIGWFQGQMEGGPRALGNRSILANPTNPDTKDHLNKRVKRRESFRPFAPAVIEEEADGFFKEYYSSPYMLTVLPVKEDKKHLIPAVCHIDDTGRLQTVNKDINPLFHKLVSNFHRLSGVPVVLNTSYNVRGEPIVCSVGDALNCFNGTDLDALVIGKHLIEKQNVFTPRV